MSGHLRRCLMGLMLVAAVIYADGHVEWKNN